MSVSHLVYDLDIVEAGVNYEEVKKGRKECMYSVKERGFQELLQAIILGSKAVFSYTPTDEEIKKYFSTKNNVPMKTYAQHVFTQEEI